MSRIQTMAAWAAIGLAFLGGAAYAGSHAWAALARERMIARPPDQVAVTDLAARRDGPAHVRVTGAVRGTPVVVNAGWDEVWVPLYPSEAARQANRPAALVWAYKRPGVPPRPDELPLEGVLDPAEPPPPGSTDRAVARAIPGADKLPVVRWVGEGSGAPAILLLVVVGVLGAAGLGALGLAALSRHPEGEAVVRLSTEPLVGLPAGSVAESVHVRTAAGDFRANLFYIFPGGFLVTVAAFFVVRMAVLGTWHGGMALGLAAVAVFGLGVVGVGLIGAVAAEGPTRVEVHPGGLRWQVGDAVREAAWADIPAVYVAHDKLDYLPGAALLDVRRVEVKIVLRTGEAVRFDGGLTEARPLALFVSMRHAEAHLPAAREAFARGEPAAFGPVTLTRTGATVRGGREYRWADLAGSELTQEGGFRFETRSRWSFNQYTLPLPAEDIPNLLILGRLVEEQVSAGGRRPEPAGRP